MHAQTKNYFGEKTAAPLLAWMNSAARKKSDLVEKLLVANADLSDIKTHFAAAKRIRTIVSRAKIRLTPELAISGGALDLSGKGSELKIKVNWVVDWRPRGKHLKLHQADALYRLLELASRGLLWRIRKCANSVCGLWYFARFTQQRFHNMKCQQAVFRSDPEWKRKRAEYMRKLRENRF